MPLSVAIEMDECIISQCHSTGEYTREATRVCHNIVRNSKLLGTEPRVLCAMSNDDSRATELRQHMDSDAETAAMVQSMLKEKYDSVSANNTAGVLRCRVCKGSDVSFQQKQTRGADEAMTIFCICVCGARWKMS